MRTLDHRFALSHPALVSAPFKKSFPGSTGRCWHAAPSALPVARSAAPWPIPNDGIVLLWPLLPSLLEQQGIELRSREPASGYQAVLAL
ncbi:unnamed protein product [Mycetohabitans rhizoxinica HKI 454]|uniref:Uncharacterized protein n=1 Tax=Mycetohabitans rhizoxinica (strain DSM 19002 / CIP 109453 / HKI 454) TaxID=882378 RepID=E5ASS9_MYCRK|nr:unnamed protein product [Mycetohabitans rhizoxinica HKI 454]